MNYGFGYGDSFIYMGEDIKTKFGITVSSRVLHDPNKTKIKGPLPYTNIVYDFSEVYGGQVYEERVIEYVVNLYQFGDRLNVDNKRTAFVNWLLNSHGKQVLVDDTFPEYYFLAEVEEGSIYNRYEDSTISFRFICYPFMISRKLEGDDVWDTFNFDLDVSQNVKFTAESDWSSFKKSRVGDQASYTAWATDYDGGEDINIEQLGRTYKITDIRNTSSSASSIAYKLEGQPYWLMEQDVLQAQTKWTDVMLVNNGATDVVPKITTSNKVSIEHDGIIFNLFAGTHEIDEFTLHTGVNTFKMYAHARAHVSFEFRKELI